MVARTERLGLVVKAPNPADARSVLVRLSDDGEQRVQALRFAFAAGELWVDACEPGGGGRSMVKPR